MLNNEETPLSSNQELFKSYLSTEDVLLYPTIGLLSSRSDALTYTKDNPVLYNSPMDMVASQRLFNELYSFNQAAVSCRFFTETQRLKELYLNYNKKNYWFTVGASEEDYLLLESYSKIHPNFTVNVSVDVAHGCTSYLLDLYSKYFSAPWCKSLMSGTVATPETAWQVYNHGCTHIRVGIGPGSACSTRIVTGCGVPNLTAVFQIWNTFQGFEKTIPPRIIADGGIKTTSDIAKYLSAGADGVMIGNLFSRCHESAGWSKNIFYSLAHSLIPIHLFKNKIYSKKYRGQASSAFQLERRGSVSGAPEGVEGQLLHPEYFATDLMQNIFNSLASSLSYLGLRRIKDLSPDKVKFIRITPSSVRESNPNPNFR